MTDGMHSHLKLDYILGRYAYNYARLYGTVIVQRVANNIDPLPTDTL